MSAADGAVLGTTRLVDHGPDAVRYNVVVLGDGYRASEIAKYHADVQAFVDALHAAPPFDDLWCGLNVHRVDVTSTDSGADDPAGCGDGTTGSGASARTRFDATFCGDGNLRRLLTCDAAAARAVALATVPAMHMTLVLVNTPLYGGSGGSVATISTHADAVEIALHEMGHTAFGLADEYEYFAGCGSGETGHDTYAGPEPVEPNVTCSTSLFTLKWNTLLSTPADPLPTTVNANCAQCDPQPNPKPAGYVGLYAGARHFHCGCYRASFDCRMRTLGHPFCAVCRRAIRDTLRGYLPVAYQGLWWAAPAGSESGWGLNVAHQNDLVFATWFTYDAVRRPWWLSMTANRGAGESFSGTFYATRGPAFDAVPYDPAQVVATPVGSATLAFTSSDAGTFQWTVQGTTRSKPIVRDVFASPVPTCRFGAEPDLSRLANYQDVWWAAPAGSQPGWGVNLAHQGNVIFATWFTYDATGAPWWLSATATMTGAGVYVGTLDETRGPPYDAVPFDPAQVTTSPVGTLTLAFADGNHATFDAVVRGVAFSRPITRMVFRAPGTACA